MANSEYKSAQYQRNRTLVLGPDAACHWCGKPATAVDHLVEVDRGGTSELENLVASCKTCNSKRGAYYKNAKAKKTQEIRKIAALRADSVSFSTETGTPSLLPRVLPKTDVATPISHDLPRLRSMAADSAGSFGPDVARWAEDHLGLVLMPWQREALAGQLAYDDDGRLAHTVSLVSVARQNGKSVCLEALIGWWLTERSKTHGRQLVVSTASSQKLLSVMFRHLAPILEEKFGGKPFWSRGAERVDMPDGSEWMLQAATNRAGHGFSIDLVTADEIYDISSDIVEQGLMPAQRARPDPLFSMWSTAGHEGSEVMIRWREQGIAAIDSKAKGLHFAEWSPPAGTHPLDPATWAWANPALGHTLRAEVLERESAGPNRQAFLRASLNMWVGAVDSWIPPGKWEDGIIDDVETTGGVLAIEGSFDETRYVAVRSVAVGDTIHVSIAHQAVTLNDLWEWVVEELAADKTTRALIGVSLAPTMPHIVERRSSTVGYAESCKWTSAARALIIQGRIRHNGDVQLAEQVGRSVAVPTKDGWVISSRKSPGPVELARCLVWSASVAARPVSASKPAMASSRRATPLPRRAG